jgi:predicted methyltransferase
VLRPGGRIVVIDFQKRPLPVGPPVHMKLAPHQVTREFEQAGFRLARQFDFLPHQYFLVFQR